MNVKTFDFKVKKGLAERLYYMSCVIVESHKVTFL